MSKTIVASSLGVIGTGGTVLTGAYYLGAFDSKEGIESKGLISTPQFSKTFNEWEISVDYSNFVDDTKVDCIEKTFNPKTKPKESLDRWKEGVTQEKDNNFSLSTTEKSIGCLVIATIRKGGEANKWYGQLAFLWAFAQENKGFIAYSAFSIPKEESNVATAESLIYTLSKEEEQKKEWKITSKYEKAYVDKWKIGIDDLPKNGDTLSELSGRLLGGLATDDNDLKNLAKEEDLTNTQPLKKNGFYYEWAGKGDGQGKNITSWSSNLNNWWGKVFKDEKNDVLNKVKGFKGEWKLIAKKDTN